MRFNGEGKYGDWVERLVYNGIGATIPMHNGLVQYESDYHTAGAWKRNVTDPWSCCAGTRSEAIADYVDQVYFRDAESIYVNLFTPSTVRWGHSGTTITISQTTDFPETAATTLTVRDQRSHDIHPGSSLAPVVVGSDDCESERGRRSLFRPTFAVGSPSGACGKTATRRL